MKDTQHLNICLWFDNEAEEAANFYTSVFKNSSIGHISRYGKEGFEFHGKPEGTALTVSFKLNNMSFNALNGGPQFKFNESVSIVVNCDTQEEIDHYWNHLTSGGGKESQCGWLKDKYGLWWQIVPTILGSLMSDPAKAPRVMNAFMKMKKFDIATLVNA
ncbi:MAG: VOC family protein [Bacteroidetes bacterium]|nr:VOC family protein [Bacteroidota bacterium]